MDCARCGATAQEGQRFCGQCGQSLAAVCPSCGTENPSGHRFCGNCGHALTGQAPAVSQPHVTSVERRVVSVLFIDLVGFTSFSAERDPEDVRAMITEYFDLARDVIDRFGGTVDKFIGDAVMAWWGATTSQEDDAERAVRAALELVERVASMGERIGVPGLAARAAVMTGEVSVGPGGNEKGLLLGDLVNASSRLQSVAQPGSVYVGEATAALVGTAIDLVDAGSHLVKGRDEPVVAFQAVRVLGERGGRGRSDTLEPPFVGRVAELRLLKDALHATGREARARLVSLVGQAGIGKSRLIWEFQKYVDGLIENVYWHEGRSPSYGDGLSLWALAEMIRRRAGIQETDDDEVTATRLSQMVDDNIVDGDMRAWVDSRLAALLGLEASVAGERTELYAAARALFEGIADKGSCVLVFEDLHWADPGLLEFIEELPDWSQGHPILIVTLARPDLLDRRPDWGSGRRGFSSTYLGPLADDEMVEMIGGTVPGLPRSGVERIVAAAGGVPLFAVEMLRMLLAEGRLVVSDDGVVVAGDVTTIEVPGSVQAVVAARLDRLPADERDVTRDAAVLGQSFTVEALAALRGEEVDKLERRLGDLVRREILELVRDPRSPERGQYRWVQSVLREVAYGRIARGDRHRLHLDVARHFRDLGDVELAPVAAAHFVAASEHAPATDPALHAELAEALRAAIGRAQAIHAHEQILSLVGAALPVVPEGIEPELREMATMAAIRIGEYDTAHAHADAFQALADRSGDLALRHRAIALAGRVGNETRDPDRSRRVLEPHLQAYPDFASDANLARAAVYLARARLLTGDNDGAAALADDALGAVERLGLIDEVADAMVTRGTALASTRIHQAMALLRGALEVCNTHGLIHTKLRTLINIGFSAQDTATSLAASEEAFEEAKRIGDRGHASFVAGNLFGGYMLRMDHDAAERMLADPVRIDTATDEVHRLGGASLLRLRLGERQEADALLAEAVRLSADVSDPQTLLEIDRTRCAFLMMDADFSGAFDIARRGYEESEFVPWFATAMAGAAAALAGDMDMLSAVEAMTASLSPGQFTDNVVRLNQAMLTLVGGDAERAEVLFDQALAGMEESGDRFGAFETAVAAARHLPAAGPARGRYRDRARALAEQSNAPGLVDFVDRVAPASEE